MVTTCPVCYGGDSRECTTLTDHWSGEAFRLHRCESCRTYYLKDPPDEAALARYYDNPLGAAMWEGSSKSFSILQRLAFARDFSPLFKVLPQHATIVDYGAGAGEAARYIHSRGYQVHALDMYDSSQWKSSQIDYRQVNLNGDRVTQDNLLWNGKAPDAVFLRHVLEHLANPRRVLELFARLEIPYVLIVVPNVNSWLQGPFGHAWYYWDPPRHLTFFSRQTLSQLCDAAGYEVIKFRHYGIDEVVTSLFRWILLREQHTGRTLSPNEFHSRLSLRLLQPKGILAGLSSGMSCWLNTVCWCLARRRN